MEHFTGTMVKAHTGKDPLITIWDKPNLSGMCASITDPKFIDTVIEELQKVKIILDKSENLWYNNAKRWEKWNGLEFIGAMERSVAFI